VEHSIERKTSVKKARLIAAILFLPSIVFLALEFFNIILYLGKNVSVSSLPFWMGIGLYFIFQGIFFRPIRTYIFGHELTHAIVGLISGAKIKGFKVGSSSGSVRLTKINIFTTLSPYFIPVYTVLLILLYWALKQFADVKPYHSYFLFFVGFSLSFHYSLTHYAISQGQSDLKKFGVFFSSLFIILINCILLTGLLKLLFPGQVSLKQYYLLACRDTFEFWKILYLQGKNIWAYFR
jgi:hypothetical protein